MTATPEQVTLTQITHTYQIDGQPLDGQPLAVQQMGNGRRRILARQVGVTTYPDQPGHGHILIEGRVLRADGTLGKTSGVGYTVGGRWDDTASVPAWAMRIATPLIGGPA